MQIEIRLKQLLDELNLNTRGVIQQMAKDLGLHRHTLRRIYLNQMPNPSLNTLALVCKWLCDHGIRQDRLPQALFGAQPSALWQAIAAAGSVRVYLGKYQQTLTSAPAWQWVAFRDACVAADIVKFLSTPGGVQAASRPEVRLEYVPFQYVQDDSVRWRNNIAFRRDVQLAESIYATTRRPPSRSSSILIGSQKANYVLEHLVADLFGCQPFCLPREGHPRPPFYTVYRERDCAVPSCFGGRQSPPGYSGKATPGVYYLDNGRKWVAIPWREDRQDSGIIIVAYDPGTETMQIALSGYTGRGTARIGAVILHPAYQARLWPPPVVSHGKKMGVYVCRFTLHENEMSSDEIRPLRAEECEIIQLDERVLAECVHPCSSIMGRATRGRTSHEARRPGILQHGQASGE